MKINSKITTALMTLGLVSAASASGTYTDAANASGYGANTIFKVVYITGSTAFRTQVNNALAAAPGAGNVFDAAPVITQSLGSSQKAFWGKIGTHPYIIETDFTGSEAGIASLVNTTIKYSTAGDGVAGAPNPATLPGTPQPTGFINPADGTADLGAVAPDLAFADTSLKVSLTSSANLTDYGIVAVIPFEWVKGYYHNGATAADTSWKDLQNITIPQATYLLTGGSEAASFFTGNPLDTDSVYLIGRNEGSGTRVNTTLLSQYPSPSKFDQNVIQGASYVNGVLTAGAVGPAAGIVDLAQGYEGYDSGGSVATDLECDTSGLGSETIGYLGISDATTAIGGGAVKLTLDGVAENDENVINGEYSFWGHEHLYGAPGQAASDPGGVVANVLDGGVVNDTIYTHWTHTAGALETQFTTGAGYGGDQADKTQQSTAVDPALMQCDKPQSGDTGYPSQ